MRAGDGWREGRTACLNAGGFPSVLIMFYCENKCSIKRVAARQRCLLPMLKGESRKVSG